MSAIETELAGSAQTESTSRTNVIPVAGDEREARRGSQAATPILFHKIKNTRSILSLVVSDSRIFAGTQGGEIIVWSFQTYEEIIRLDAHRGAVLSLFLSPNGQRLFSSAGDAIVNIWSTKTFAHLCSIYSTFDVGDIFCVVYSSILDTVILGAQNTSIQWYDLSRKDVLPRPDLKSHPSQRNHRFFDSKGPGGVSTPRHDSDQSILDDSQLLEISRNSIIQYAHYGYVYCMVLTRNSSSEEGKSEYLISGGGDGTVKLWNVLRESGQIQVLPVATLAKHKSGDNSVLTMALKDTLLYAGKLEGEIDVWDLDTRQCIQTFKASSVDVLSLAVDFGHVFAGTASGQAKIFERYKKKTDWKAHDHLILAISLTENNGKPYLVTGGNDDCVAIWDLTSFFGTQVSSPRATNEQLVQSLSRFVSFRTVSSKSDYTEDCRQGASWLRNLFKRFGAQTELLKTGEGLNPIVYACFRGKSSNGKRTLFYGHYDVVPAENEHDQWKSDPFSLHGKDSFLYGRGVSDNKGPVLAAAYAVADLLASKQLNSDVVFLIEGEEERGSRGFEKAFKTNKHLIGEITWILLANSYWLSNDFPCLTYGLRGVVHASITVESGSANQHSGVNGSNATHEPLKDLVALISAISTPNDNKVQISGFYNDIRPFTSQEEQWYTAISQFLSRSEHIIQDSELLKSKWREPSFTVHGFTTSSSGVATVIPHRAKAEVSFRLVPDQEAEEIAIMFEEHVKTTFANLSTRNKLTIKINSSVDPWVGDTKNGLYQALEKAIIEVWGLQQKASTPTKSSRKDSTPGPTKSPLYIREGGSIPAIRFLEKELSAPAAQLPCGQASDNAHLENERMRLTNLYNAREIFKKVFRELSTE